MASFIICGICLISAALFIFITTRCDIRAGNADPDSMEETLYFVFTIVCGFLAVCNGVAAIVFFIKMLIEVAE